nr:unnamed protein product [Callosobruchus analis]
MNDPNLSNIREIDLSGSYEIMEKYGASEAITNQTDRLKAIKTYMRALAKTADWQLGHHEVQRIVKNKDEKFDLIITEVVYPTHMGFVDRFKVPFIGIASHNQERNHRKIGNLLHPIIFPDTAFPLVPPLRTFKERLLSVFYTVVTWCYYEWWLYPEQTAVARKHLGEEIRNLQEIEADMSFLFVTLNPALTKQYMDDAKEGVIYFSLGTNVKSYLLDDKIKSELLEAFAELPYKILWKYEGDSIANLPKNVKIFKWIPQQDILEESIVNHVQMVAIPFIYEQSQNARLLVEKGIGLVLDKDNITKEALKDAILEVIENPKFKRNVVELGNLSKDMERPGLEKAVWWTEYCLRNKGAKHLKSPATDIPLYQFLMLDVIAAVFALLLTVIIIAFTFIKITVRFIRCLLRIICRKNTEIKHKKFLSNIREIDLSGSYEIMEKYGASEAITNQTDKLKAIKTYMKALAMTSDWQLAHHEVQRIVKNKDVKFDLIITEVVYPTHLGFVDRFKVPYIGVASFDQERSHRRLGNLVHPIIFPDTTLPLVPPLSFKERLFSVLFTVVMWCYAEWWLYPEQTAVARKHLGEEIRNIQEIEADMSFLFVTLNPALTKVRPIGLNTIVISGMHLREPEPLPKDLKQYMDDAKEGVIYFSLGTNVKAYLLNDKVKTGLLEAFAELPYKILWKYEGTAIPNLLKNVKILKWIPQQDLLGHRNIKLFITQCGLQSLEEAVVNHVPMVAIPFIPEQRRNARLLVEKEYCLRNKGAKHLKSPATDIPLYQFFMLDVIAAVFALLLTVIIITFTFIKITIRFVRYIMRIVCTKNTEIKHKEL